MRGGALKNIGSITPDITSPEVLDELCEFDLLFAHGMSMIDEFMIVPENTFILFMTPSSTFLHTRRIQNKLLSQSRDKYMNDMYNVFFKGTHNDPMLRPYEGAYVYTPGDIINNTRLSFTSEDHNPYALRIGMYPLPITSLSDFGLRPTISIIPFIINKIINTKEIDADKFAADAGIKAIEEWNSITKQPTIDDMERAYMIIWGERPHLRELRDWFENVTTVLDKYIDKYIMNGEFGNKISYNDPFINNKKLSSVAEVLNGVAPEKKYRFIIVTSCRPPNIDTFAEGLGEWESHRKLTVSDPSKLDVPTSWRTIRRGSFSAKGSDVTCPLGPGVRPMNLAHIKIALEDILFKKKLVFNKDSREGRFIDTAINVFFRRVDNNSVKVLHYKPSINSKVFAKFLNILYMDYPILQRNNMNDASNAFKIILEGFRGILNEYVLGIRMDTMAQGKNTGKTLGTELLQLLKYPGPKLETNNQNANLTQEIRKTLNKLEANKRGGSKRKKVQKTLYSKTRRLRRL